MRTGRAFPAHVILIHGALETKVVSPPVAAATGSVPTPVISITLLVPVAAATGIAPTPSLGLDVLDLPPAATATASAPTPQAGLDITIAPPSASVSAAFVPSVGIGNNTILAPPAVAWAGQAVFDTFQRTRNAGDFGVSTSGQSWNFTQGTETSDHTVDGNEAIFAFPVPDTDREQLLGFTWTNVDMRCRFRFSAAPTASQVVFSMALRYADATNIYRVNFQYKAVGAPTLTFTRGVSTSIGSTINAATISPNTWYWLRGRIDGTGFLYSKTWPDGTDEPKDWQNTFDDGANGSVSGSIGLRAQTQSGNGSLNLLMDDVYAGGTGTGASTPSISITLLPPAATATASTPTVTTTQVVLITPATATGSAPAPAGESDVLLLAPAPTATASVPTVIATVVAFTPASTATASAPQPALSITLFPPAPTATASSTAVVKLTLLPNAATATASSTAPTLTITVFPPAALATASVTGVLAAVLVLPAPASASASSITPILVITSTVIVTPAGAVAMSAAKLITGTRYHGWKARPITPTMVAIGNNHPVLSLSLTFDFTVYPIVRGTYMVLDAIHRHRSQTYQFVNGAWVPRTYVKQLPDGTHQTFTYSSSDGIALQIVGSGERFFALGITDQKPVAARAPITPGLMHRIDILADCSNNIWTGRWKFDSIEQHPITTERRAEYYLPDVQSSLWRQVTLAPDTDSQYNDFEILGFDSDVAGTYPLP